MAKYSRETLYPIEIGATVTKELNDRLTATAERYGRSKASVIRSILERGLKTEQDRLRREAAAADKKAASEPDRTAETTGETTGAGA